VILSFLLACALFFVLTWSQATTFNFPAWMHRWIRLAAGYSLTLYVIHYSIIAFIAPYVDWLNSTVALLLLLAVCNAAALLLALPTEMQHKKLALRLRASFS